MAVEWAHRARRDLTGVSAKENIPKIDDDQIVVLAGILRLPNLHFFDLGSTCRNARKHSLLAIWIQHPCSSTMPSAVSALAITCPHLCTTARAIIVTVGE